MNDTHLLEVKCLFYGFNRMFYFKSQNEPHTMFMLLVYTKKINKSFTSPSNPKV